VKVGQGAGAAVVTGAASGIGQALARALAARGSHVVIADIDAAAAQRTAAEIDRETPGSARPAALDVRNADAFRTLIERVDHERGLDLLINNAGIAVTGPAEELTTAHWARQLDTNLWGVIHGVSAAYPLMRARGHGQILNTASLAGLVPAPGLLLYSTSKHAVVGLTLALRGEASASGVRVSALCPGWVDTPLLDAPNPADLPAVSARRGGREAIRAAGLGPPIPPEAVAALALRGLDRNQALIVGPLAARAYWRAWRYAPAAVDRLTARLARRLGEGAASTPPIRRDG
jgi:NAD(P)-dependent dehydrogenase (short-subunit alcohol dehydrogenase family)